MQQLGQKLGPEIDLGPKIRSPIVCESRARLDELFVNSWDTI